jgi:hypothetical protein
LSRQPSGLARHLEYDEKVVAHFDVRSCSAADLPSVIENGRLDAARDVVVHVDAEAPTRMMTLLNDLVDEHGVAPERLTAVVTGDSSPAAVLDRLGDLGLSPPSVISEHELETGARRLIMQLSTRPPIANGA